MDDTFLVGGVQGIGDLNGQTENFVDRQRTAPNPVLQRLAFEKFQNEERLLLVFAYVVNGADVRMVECRGRPCFPLKTLQRRWLDHPELG